jgi:hypothetical protein
MAQRSIARMYDSYEAARSVVNNLEQAGIPHSDISLVANADAHGRYTETSTASTADKMEAVDPASTDDTNAGAGAKRGAVVGTVLGGGAGLLAGIGALAIPGIGPVVAAGWLIATLAGAGVGAASGGLVGSLTGAGIGHDEAHVYSEGVKRGSSLVTVRVDDADVARVESVLSQSGAVDWQERRASYGPSWTGSNEAVPPVAAPDAALGEVAAPTTPQSRI